MSGAYKPVADCPDSRRHLAPAVYDNGFRPHDHDGQYNERHGWPQQEVRGVPDRMSGAYKPVADDPDSQQRVWFRYINTTDAEGDDHGGAAVIAGSCPLCYGALR
jgi:hypothetical protein